MKNNTITIVLLAVALLMGFAIYQNPEFKNAFGLYDGSALEGSVASTTMDTASTSTTHSLITVESLSEGDTITSGQIVTGRARGYWFFEASFPVRVYDANNNELGVNIATANSDWMTEDFVPFTVNLNFATPTTPTGKIRFEKDNPSGETQFDDSYEMNINF
jgi:hypothetical protein